MNNKNYSDQFIKLSDILNMLSISRKTWFEWIKDGHAPEPVKFGPKTFRWHEKDIKEYINKNHHLDDNKEY
jgi:prophage regulatory protein